MRGCGLYGLWAKYVWLWAVGCTGYALRYVHLTS
jgi:hypothetical protein